VFVFGSAARGDDHAGSDIDLLVVRPDAVDEDDDAWIQQLYELTDAVEAWTGNTVDLLHYSESTLRGLETKRDPLVTELRRDALRLFGASLHELLGART
jgi:predicted nucleotidyltransferase